MEYQVSRRGAAVVSVQLTALAGLVCWVLGASFEAGVLALGLFFVCAAVLLTLGTAHLASCRVRCGQHHLTVRRGLLFLSTRRLPLRFVTGCHVLRTPLSRLAGTCTLVLLSSGCLTLLPGLSEGDAQRLSAFLSYERGAL